MSVSPCLECDVSHSLMSGMVGPGPDVSRFTTLTRSRPGCVDNMQAYIIQEAEQINQCIMGLRSEKLPKLQETICSYTILPSKRQQRSVRSGVIKCSNSKIKLNVDALQIEQNLNSYF